MIGKIKNKLGKKETDTKKKEVKKRENNECAYLIDGTSVCGSFPILVGL